MVQERIQKVLSVCVCVGGGGGGLKTSFFSVFESSYVTEGTKSLSRPSSRSASEPPIQWVSLVWIDGGVICQCGRGGGPDHLPPPPFGSVHVDPDHTACRGAAMCAVVSKLLIGNYKYVE